MDQSTEAEEPDSPPWSKAVMCITAIIKVGMRAQYEGSASASEVDVLSSYRRWLERRSIQQEPILPASIVFGYSLSMAVSKGRPQPVNEPVATVTVVGSPSDNSAFADMEVFKGVVSDLARYLARDLRRVTATVVCGNERWDVPTGREAEPQPDFDHYR